MSIRFQQAKLNSSFTYSKCQFPSPIFTSLLTTNNIGTREKKTHTWIRPKIVSNLMHLIEIKNQKPITQVETKDPMQATKTWCDTKSQDPMQKKKKTQNINKN